MHDPVGILMAVQTLCCAAMTGIIWFVQVVHYPSFRTVDRGKWTVFHERHTRATGWVVGPLMLAEWGAAVGVLGWIPEWWRDPEQVVLLLLLAVVWAATFGWSVPEHRTLTRGYDEAAVGRLIRRNWVRTAAWTVRSFILALWMVRMH
jgi:hypothetical protein